MGWRLSPKWVGPVREERWRPKEMVGRKKRRERRKTEPKERWRE